MNGIYVSLLTILLGWGGAVACQSAQQSAGDKANVTATPPTIVRSSQPRITNPAVSESDVQTLVADNQTAAFSLYQQLKSTNDNLFFSPHNISSALAMLYAGALGDTATEMAAALTFNLPQPRLHPAFNRLDLDLHTNADQPGFILHTVNQLWGQDGYAFQPAYLDTLAQQYDAGIGILDFVGDPEGGRRRINNWVASVTKDVIKDLIPPGAITSLTRMVLTNAIYFYGAWGSPFKAAATSPQLFHHRDGSNETLPMMSQLATYKYARGDNYQLISLPYDQNEAEMLIWLPDEGAWQAVEDGMNARFVAESVSRLAPAEVQLGLPKWTMATQLSLRAVLEAMGMHKAFDAATADLSGIAADGGLYVMDAIHKAYVRVDEKGTEAAAATGIVVGTTSMPVIDVHLTIDHSFIFAIRHVRTGALLFLGRYL